MARILIGNEWGGGSGHALHMREVATRLSAQGHTLFLAVNDLVEAESALRDFDGPVFQAPRCRGGLLHEHRATSFGDIMANLAFADAGAVAASADGWLAYLEAIDPDVVVVDYSPLLCVAARDRWPVATFGNGYCTPPAHLDHFPLTRDGGSDPFPESTMVENTNRWLRAHGRSELERLPSIHPVETSYAVGLPELDPYAAYRVAPSQPLLHEMLPEPVDQEPPSSGPVRVFAYLSAAQTNSMKLLATLSVAGCHVEAFLRDGRRDMYAYLAQYGVNVLARPRPIREAVADSHLFVHHGSGLCSIEGLALGRPQLCIPMDGEKELLSTCLESLGVARVIRDFPPDDDHTAAVMALAGDDAVRSAAREWATTLAARTNPDPIDHFASVVESMCAQ